MKLGHLKVHGIWAAAMVGAFVGGTQISSNSSEKARTAEATPSDRNREQAGLRITGGSSGSDGEISDRGGRRGGASSADRLSDIFGASTFASGIEQLSLEALRDPNQLKRRLAFTKLLEGMTPENAAAIRDQLVSAGARGSEWRDFNYAWGALAGQEAFDSALLGEQKDMESLLSGWAASDPTSAMAMMDRLPEELRDQKEKLETGIVSGLADRDRDMAAGYVARLEAEGRKDAHRLMEIVAGEALRSGGPAEASAWTETLPDGPLKGAAMNEVAERYVRDDPKAASVWIEKFATEDYATRVVAKVGKEWAEKDPLAAVGWLDNLPGGEGQKSGLSSAFGDWEDKDPVAAGNYLLSMPSSAKRDSAISGFATGYAWQDPETAIAWAQDIGNPDLRNQSLARAGQAFLRRDPEGAKTWLSTSGLSAEVQQAIQTPRRR